MNDRFARIGNNLSADFANTVVSFERADGSLHTAADVIDFLLDTNALAPAEATRLRALVRGEAGARLVALALNLRAAVTAALEAIEHGAALDREALALINQILAIDSGFEQLERGKGGYALVRRRLTDDPARALVPIARDTAQLLATPGAPVRHCAGVDCVRHFYDDSRTGRRRWCDMAICGNRAKVAAFTARRAKSDPA